MACKDTPLYEQVAVLTASVTTSLWVAYFATREKAGWRRLGWCSACVLYDMVFLILVVLVGSIFTPAYQCYTDRSKAVELVVAASAYKEAIAARAVAQQSVVGSGAGLSIEPRGQMRGGAISRDGVISLYSEEPPALVELTPTWDGTAVEWTCAGFPLKSMPLLCKNPPRLRK